MKLKTIASEDERMLAVELYLSGYSSIEVGQYLNRDGVSVRNWVLSQGQPMRTLSQAHTKDGKRSVNKEGYCLIRVKGKRVREHRHIMEQLLGRPLRSDEFVHHINGDRLDNRPENLELWPTRPGGRGQPPGQRLIDRVTDAVETIRRYPIEALKVEPNLEAILGNRSIP
jgi:hypothetical protein